MKNKHIMIVVGIVVALVVVLIAIPRTRSFLGFSSANLDFMDASTQEVPELPQNKNLDVEIITEAENLGDVVEVGDTLQVHYVGTLTDGVEFDNSRKRGTPLEFTLGTTPLIKGFEEGVIGMRVGEVRRLIISPEYAYGLEGNHPLAGQTLIFDLELVGLDKK